MKILRHHHLLQYYSLHQFQYIVTQITTSALLRCFFQSLLYLNEIFVGASSTSSTSMEEVTLEAAPENFAQKQNLSFFFTRFFPIAPFNINWLCFSQSYALLKTVYAISSDFLFCRSRLPWFFHLYWFFRFGILLIKVKCLYILSSKVFLKSDTICLIFQALLFSLPLHLQWKQLFGSASF